MNNIITSAAIVGVLFIIFYIPFLLAKGVSQMAYGKKLEGGIVARCWIPIYNIFYADKTYFGKLHLASYGFIIMVVCTVLRVVQWRYMYSNEILARVFIMLFYLSIAAWYIMNCVTSFLIINESGAVSVIKAVIYSIVYPFGYFYIGQFLTVVVTNKLNQRSDKSWDDDGDNKL